jgi:hypothetical protein
MCKSIPVNLFLPPPEQTPEQARKIKEMDQKKKDLAREHLLKVQVALSKRSFGTK